jgi:hypothetical protein
MIVQWCCKGLAKVPDEEINAIVYGHVGLRCRAWTTLAPKTPYRLANGLRQLTEYHLDLHVNNYSYPDPRTSVPFYKTTPFISLSAGCVDRDITIEENITHRAWRTAVHFATTDFADPDFDPDDPRRCAGWVLVCYVLVSANRAVAIPSVAEEIRELNQARAYSNWHTQGEITAKINVPSTQILGALYYAPISFGEPVVVNYLVNPRFTHPAALPDERMML